MPTKQASEPGNRTPHAIYVFSFDNNDSLKMGDKFKVSFQCDECGHPYEVSHERLLIPGEGLEFHVGVSKRCHPVNYCRMCLADKLRLLADEILESWPDFVVD